MTSVDLVHLTKKFENGFIAVDDFSLSIRDGEVLVLVGPSGCGKSTVLRMLAGLEKPTSGDVMINGENVVDIDSQHRDIAMVFQSYALYPHMTVRENLGFGLTLHHVDKHEIVRRVDEIAEMLDITPILDRKPKQLSGGQRQRVAMGRAIVRNPAVFLMDEPLSNLDAKLRVHMRSEIGRIQQQLGVTTLYVTHDQVEAMTMGDRVAVMDKGKLIQIGTPKDLYDNPSNAFVAGFLGSPSMNVFEGHLELDDAGIPVLCFGTNRIVLEMSDLDGEPLLAEMVVTGEKLDVGIRPEDLEDNRIALAPQTKVMTVSVQLVEQLGSAVMAHFVLSTSDKMIASFDPRSQALEGETMDVAITTSRLHFFSKKSGISLRSSGLPVAGQAKTASSVPTLTGV